MKWFFLLLLTVAIFTVGLFTHSIFWMLFAGLVFFLGLFIFDALEKGGSENEFLNEIVKMIEKIR